MRVQSPHLAHFFRIGKWSQIAYFSIGKAKFSPAALIDTITGPTEGVSVDFGWSEENTKEMLQPGIEPAPEGRENFSVLQKVVKRPLSQEI